MRKKIFYSLAALSGLIADEPCDITVMPERLTARHIEAKGIGYNQGYSTIEGFFTHPDWVNGAFVPFLDLRGHIFNDGNPAANAGVGLRYLDSMVWGLNAYYDYRKTEHQNYNQVSLGFEALGEVWDFRLNGYFPVGRTKSHFYHPKFHEFKQHHMIISLKKEFAMTGTNAEVGAHFNAGKHVDLYAAAGPYYFAGDGKHAIGGQGRLYGTIWDYVGLEIKGSYDNVFRGIIQGELSIIIPFSSKKHVKQRQGISCPRDKALRSRAYQRVDRQEIITLDHKREHRVAINPATDQPWFFWFVNNTSHSLGTFESPFPTLREAQNTSSPGDVIYVFSGDGTSTGLNQGITLQDNQKLFGSGVKQLLKTTQGKIRIPAFTNNFPLLINTNLGLPILVLANGNEVSGFNITRAGVLATNIVSGIGINGSFLHNNIIIGGQNQFALLIQGRGLITLIDNQFFNPTPGASAAILLVTDASAVISGQTSNNTFAGYTGSIRLDANNGGAFSYEIANNAINTPQPGGTSIVYQTTAGLSGLSNLRIANNILNIPGSGEGISIVSDGAGLCLHIDNNIISGPLLSDGIFLQTGGASTGSLRAVVTNNIIDQPGAGAFGINALTTGATTMCLRLIDNTVTNGTGYRFANPAGTFFLEPTTGNTGTVAPTVGTITFVPPNTCQCGQ